MSVRAPRGRGAQIVRGAFRRRRLRVHDPSAFQIWRSDELENEHMRAAVLGDLEPVTLLAEPRWRHAAEGDASAAIALTLEHLWGDAIADVRRDLILSALWVSASAGDPASRLLLRVMRQRIGELELR